MLVLVVAGGRDRGKNCRQSPARDAGSSGLAGDRGYEHLKMSNWARRRGEDSPCVSSVQLCGGGSAVSCCCCSPVEESRRKLSADGRSAQPGVTLQIIIKVALGAELQSNVQIFVSLQLSINPLVSHVK